MKVNERLIFVPSFMKFIYYLGKHKEAYASQISTGLDITFSHIVNVRNSLENIDIVKSKIKGRERLIYLTEKGERIYENIDNIFKELGIIIYCDRKERERDITLKEEAIVEANEAE